MAGERPAQLGQSSLSRTPSASSASTLTSEVHDATAWHSPLLEGTRQLHAFVDTADIQLWVPGRFRMERTIQVPSRRNRVQVDDMFDVATGSRVIVKKMPNDWICKCHALFTQRHPDETEKPWIDLGCSAFLTSVDYAYVCPLLGVFQGKDFTYMAMEHAPEGDLFSWSAACKEPPGLARESLVLPLARQLVDAVRQLHDLSIVHGDVSLESIVISHQPRSSVPCIQFLNFGMSTSSRYTSIKRGRPCYQAPEVHSGEVYDGFLSDAFAVGVVLSSLLMHQRPWMSTQPGCCKAFEFFRENGFRATASKSKRFLQDRTMAQCMSERMTCILEGLLSVHPDNRLTLGEVESFPGHHGASVLTLMA